MGSEAQNHKDSSKVITTEATIQVHHDCQRDPLGVHVARLLNEGVFVRLREEEEEKQNQSTRFLFPLLSASNYNKAKYFVILSGSKARSLWRSVRKCLFGGKCASDGHEFSTSRKYPTWMYSIQSAASMFFLCVIPLFSIFMAVMISMIVRVYCFILISAVTLTVDLNDLYNLMPAFAKRSLDNIVCFAKFIDQTYLYGHLLKGRNQWKDDTYQRMIDRRVPTVLRESQAENDAKAGGRVNKTFLHKDSFQRVDWYKLSNNIHQTNLEGSNLDSKTVKHLVAMNFAYVMMHGDHKSLTKAKNKMRYHDKPTRKRSMEDTSADLTFVVPDEANKHMVDKSGTIFRALHSVDGIEMMTTPSEASNLRELKRQRSSQRRNSMKSFDDTEVLPQFHSSPLRPRIYSEADVEDYEAFGSDENSAEREFNDAKNKKWLDVGARLGMRILKSEHIQDLIAQNPLASKTISGDLSCGDLEGDNEFDVPNRSIHPNGQIPKPLHSMWQIGDNDQGFDDDVSDDYSMIGSDISDSSFTESRRRRASLAFSLSPLSRRRTAHLSCSPIRTSRNGFFYKSSSVPSSPRKAWSGRKLSNSAIRDEFGGNASVASSEAIRLVPKEFNANLHLPASMAINHGVLSDNKCFESEMRVKRPQPHRQRDPLLAGVKIIVPLFPLYSVKPKRSSVEGRVHQLATVIASERISLNHINKDRSATDALSITVLLDKSFLRNGKFAKMTLRIPDSQRYFPRHSKFPIGVPIATTFGVGILVGWRTKDDCHIVRSLWQKRGPGSGHAYLNRNSLHGVLEAAIGFKVDSKVGSGKVVAYVNTGKKFLDGQYFVQMKKDGRKDNNLTIVKRPDIIQCASAKFIPVVEQLKEAAKYQIQVDNYEAERLQIAMLQEENLIVHKTWRVFSEGFELFLSSFIKAAEETDNFDSEINKFLSGVIEFLEDFELGEKKKRFVSPVACHTEQLSPPLNDISTSNNQVDDNDGSVSSASSDASNFWFIKDLFGNIMNKRVTTENFEKMDSQIISENISTFGEDSYNKVYDVLKILMRTISIAKAGCTNKPNLKMALAIIHEMLLFIHNVIKVQQINMTHASVIGWKATLEDLVAIFGPANARLRKVGNGILQRLEDHGKVAKLKALTFADHLVSDDGLIESLEAGDFKECIRRIENAAVLAEILNEELREKYHKLGVQIYNTLAPRATNNPEAVSRNGKKFTTIAKAVRLMVTPARSALTLLTNDDILEAIERILVRVFEREQEASQIINIYSWNFRTLRHLRMLNNMAIVGNLWAPILDAADEEFTWAVSRTPEQTQQYIKPVSKLFSLGVARFHEIHKSDSSVSTDWLDFLKENEAIKIIQELDGALLNFVRCFCNDMKEMVYILPYYSSIDDDILNLIDEFDPEKELRDIADALSEATLFSNYIREKTSTAVSKFLDYLPRMSIPIDRREVGDGWLLTCRGRNGKDLTLSNVSIRQENLLCKVFGGQNVLGLDDGMLSFEPSSDNLVRDPLFSSDKDGNIEISILDHVAELIRNAQNHGCWNVNEGRSFTHSSTASTSSSLNGLPLSRVLKCSIELWENLQMDDDELLEIAIREISHQIQLEKYKEEGYDISEQEETEWVKERRHILDRHQGCISKGVSFDVDICNTLSIESNSTVASRRFDPKKDPTVLYLGMNELTCSLDDFTYRLEPANRNSIFDPVLEGVGSLTIKNASIKIRIECRKEKIEKLGEELTVPVLQLQELDIGLESVNFLFKETGVDWLLNKIISNFSGKITNIVAENLQGQLSLALDKSLETLNKYIEINPELMLKILGISIEDLEENVAWV